jgi:ABC-2 type transport system permease protein
MVLWSLIKKEFLQMMRDPSSILIAFVLPLILLIIYMYGINLDTTKVKVGLLNEQPTTLTEELAAAFSRSQYMKVVQVSTRQEAYQKIQDTELAGLIVIPQDFEQKLSKGESAQLQVIVDGSETNTANFVYNYATAGLNTWYASREGTVTATQPIALQSIFWYNQDMNSHYSILPSSLAITMTLIGILLTGMVVAREWERGTMEALLAAGVSRPALVLGKYIPYYILGMTSLFSNVLACIHIFGIPFRGSFLTLFIFGSFFLLTCLGLGLLISTKLKSQFLAAQMSFMIGFIPSLLFSGMVFPLQSMPDLFQPVTRIIPARYFVLLLQNEFLVGTFSNNMKINTVYLVVLSIAFFVLVYINTPKKLQVK